MSLTSFANEQLKVVTTDYYIESSGHIGEEPIIVLYCRDGDRNHRTIEVTGFYPHFYITTEAYDELEEQLLNEGTIRNIELPSDMLTKRRKLNASIDTLDNEWETLLDEDVVRIYTNVPNDVSDIKDWVHEQNYQTFEADVFFTNRFLISNDIKMGIEVPADSDRISPSDISPCEPPNVKPNIGIVDIEVLQDGSFPEPTNAPRPVTAITAMDTYSGEYKSWILSSDMWIGKPANWKLPDTVERCDINVYDDESLLLDDFWQWVIDSNVDVMSGWNCMDPETPIQMYDGSEKKLKNVEIGDEVLGYNGDITTKSVVKDKATTVKNEYTVTTSSGREIKCSEDHRFYTVDTNGNFEYKRLSELLETDVVIRPKKYDMDTDIPELTELVPLKCQRYEDIDAVRNWKSELLYGYTNDVVEQFDVSESYAPKVDIWTPKRVKEFEHGSDTIDSDISYRRGGISLEREISTDEMYYAGLIAADGSMNEDDGIRFYNTRKELHDVFPTDHELTEDTTGCYKQNVLDYARMHAFNGLGIPFGDKNKNGMDLETIYKMPEEYIQKFIAGVIDGDGTVSDGAIYISAKHEETQKWYSKLLNRIGMPNSYSNKGVYVHNSQWNKKKMAELSNHMNHSKKCNRIEEYTISGDYDSPYEYVENVKQYTDLLFENITSIEKTDDKTKMMDIETSTHNFIANGVIVHNSSSNDRGNGFDYPYLINRSLSQNAWTMEDAARDGSTAFVTDRGSAILNGRELLDMMQSYMKTQIHEKRSYALNYIAEEELGYGKEDVGDLDKAWKLLPREFLKYNIRDVEAVAEIEQEKNILDIYDHIRSITGSSYVDIADSNIGIIDDLVLRQAQSKNKVLPTSTKPKVQYYTGAWVKEPVAGLHKNVVYPDLSSLYPNLFKDLNLSPETIVGFEEDLRDSPYTKEDCHEVYVDPRDEETKRDSDEIERKEMYTVKPSVEESFVREVIDDLIGLKYEYKKDKYADEAYSAIKRVTNSCFTPDTDVLTANGIRNITEIEVGDDVYSYNPETGEMEIKSVTETIEKPNYDGEVVHIQNENIDIKVTPDHRLLTKRPRHSDDWEITEAGDLNKWTHYETPYEWSFDDSDGIETVDICDYIETDDFIVTDDTVRKEGARKDIPRYYDGDYFIKFMGWFITEGSTFNPDEDEPRGDGICIAQYKSVNPEHFEEITELVESMDLYAGGSDRAIETCNSVLPEVLRKLCGSDSYSKNIPDFIFEECNTEQKRMLHETMMNGDGDVNSNRYSTKSDQLRDDYVRLLLEIGYAPKYKWDDGGEFNTGVWRIRFREKEQKQSFRIHRDGTTETAENGVFCIQVEDNHTMVAGRNGKFVNILNCYGVFGDSASYGVGFRLYDWRIAEAITLAGRDVIKHTASEFEDFVQDVGYGEAQIVGGDTDSAVCSIEQADGSYERVDYSEDDVSDCCEKANLDQTDTPMAETLVTAMKAAEYVDSTYDDFMQDRFNVSENNMAVEIESYASTAFFYPKKKRYAQWIRWDEGDLDNEIEVKGFELVRSDSAELTALAQKHVLELLLQSDTPKEDVREFLKHVTDQMENSNYRLEQIGKPMSINKDVTEYGTENRRPQPHIRGAKWATEHIDGEDISSGGKPLMFYVDRVAGDYKETYDAETAEDGMKVDAVSVEDASNLPEEILIDTDKMIDKVLKGPIEPILEVMGWSWSDMTTSGEQSALANFM